jgi:hypothetical protein
MFDPTSRYYAIETVTMDVSDNDGALRRIAYKKRRFIPSAEGTQTLVEHTITQGERLDNVTARYLGDPTQFWRVCDANNVLSPDELEETGTVVRIAVPNM